MNAVTSPTPNLVGITGIARRLVQDGALDEVAARDAMANGPGSVLLRTHNVTVEAAPLRPEDPEPGHYVVFSIVDSGSGMNEDTLLRAFEPFFTTKPVGKGTGLGLSISYGIVEQHGGRLSAHNADGGGAEFVLELPKAQ